MWKSKYEQHTNIFLTRLVATRLSAHLNFPNSGINLILLREITQLHLTLSSKFQVDTLTSHGRVDPSPLIVPADYNLSNTT